MDKKVLEDLKQMAKMYQQLAKALGLSLTETLLVIVSRELIILNERSATEKMLALE